MRDPARSPADSGPFSRRESVLQRRLRLAEVLDLPTFSEVVRSFVDLYRVGIKVFDERGDKLTDFKVGNGDFCGYLFAVPQGRARCIATVSRVKGGPLDTSSGAREPELGAEGQGPRGLVTVPCFTGLRYLVMPILFEGDELGRVVFGPFAAAELATFPDSLTQVSEGLDLQRLSGHLAKIRQAPESVIAKVMVSFAQVLEAQVASGQKMFLTSQLHVETTLETNRDLEAQNRRLEEMNARLKELDRLKSSFLATVSHELRTPLTSIIGYSEMLAEGLAGELNEEQNDYVRTIMDKGETLLKLISSILDISQIEAGKVRLNFEPLDLEELVQTSASSVRPQAQRKGVALDIELPPVLPVAAADREKLRQALVNLLANAVKFTPKGGRILLRLTALAEQPELSAPGYRIEIQDTGVGIPGDQFERIFDSFYQVDSSSTREFGGAGIGLAIVKSFVEGHGGKVRVESNLGEGSRFSVVMPPAPPLVKAAQPQASLPLPLSAEPDRF